MSSITAKQQHDEAVRRVADEYRRSGYDVQIEPAEGPEFLRPYRPDLVLARGDERYVVEVALPSAPKREGFWAALAQKVAAQPGWHFRIVVAGADDEGSPQIRPMPTPAEITTQLRTSERILESGQADAALMLTWASFEAAARLRMIDDDRNPARPSTPVEITKSLLRLGYIEQGEFEILRDTMSMRNNVAHGYFGAPVPPERVRFVIDIAKRLLGWSDAGGQALAG